MFGGLPGVGKSTIARLLVQDTGAVWLRIDTIEGVMRAALPDGTDLRDYGYRVAAAQAQDLLRLGQNIIADSVNPIPETREIYRQAAAAAGAALVEIEIRCSDAEQHKARVMARHAAEEGAVGIPDWAAVSKRRFDPWPEASLTLDTARLTPADAVREIRARLAV